MCPCTFYSVCHCHLEYTIRRLPYPEIYAALLNSSSSHSFRNRQHSPSLLVTYLECGPQSAWSRISIVTFQALLFPLHKFSRNTTQLPFLHRNLITSPLCLTPFSGSPAHAIPRPNCLWSHTGPFIICPLPLPYLSLFLASQLYSDSTESLNFPINSCFFWSLGFCFANNSTNALPQASPLH